ncbi:MAG: hypothetical protein PHQ25_06525 [Acidobacteriota bacterium]|nr:hypothetical protein [Acidobacteriota bacterium]MDW3229508.1 hypothetical protein [Acidobacteriota bacterium]HPB60009.1 hypothetical protein [Candidatus Saccharicenans sp.]HQO76481.1 hypothetical protein [Candidatus Saccharicenans sp.]
MKKIKVTFAMIAISLTLFLLLPGWSSVPAENCPCVLEQDCGCCPEYQHGSTVWHLIGWECGGSGGECQYRNCIYS